MECSKEIICIGSCGRTIHAFRTWNGQNAWSKALPEKYDILADVIAAREGIVVTQAGHYGRSFLQTFRATDGEKLWQYEWHGTSQSVVIQNVIYISSYRSIAALAIESGLKGKEINFDGEIISHITDDIDIYIASKASGGTKITKIRGIDGVTLWQIQLGKKAQFWAISEDALVVTVDGRILSVLNPMTGAMRWEVPINNRSFVTDISHTRVLFNQNKGTLVAVDGMTGQQLWHLDGSENLRFLHATDDLLFVMWDKHNLVCIDSATGLERWRHSFPSPVSTRMEIGEGERKLFIGTEDRFLQCLDSHTGVVAWRTPLSDRVGRLTLNDDILFCSVGSELYALAAKTGLCYWAARGSGTYLFFTGGIFLI